MYDRTAFLRRKNAPVFSQNVKIDPPGGGSGHFFEVECLKSDPKRIIFDFSSVLRVFDIMCMKLYTRIMRCGARKARKFIEKERYPWQ